MPDAEDAAAAELGELLLVAHLDRRPSGPRPFVSSFAAASTAAAKAGGVKSPGGVFTQSRVVATASATTCASSKACAELLLRAPTG